MAKIAHINYDKCISCGSCSDLDTICPVGLQVQQITHPTTYVITNNTGEWQNSYVLDLCNSCTNCTSITCGTGAFTLTDDNKDHWKTTKKSDTYYTYDIVATFNNMVSYVSIPVKKYYSYVFSMSVYSEVNRDGMAIVKSPLVTPSSLSSISSSELLKSLSGINVTGSYEYTATSDGYIYLYFITDSSNLGKYESTTDSSTGQTTGKYDNICKGTVNLSIISPYYTFHFQSPDVSMLDDNDISVGKSFNKEYNKETITSFYFPHVSDFAGNQYLVGWVGSSYTYDTTTPYDFTEVIVENSDTAFVFEALWDEKTSVQIPLAVKRSYTGSAQQGISGYDSTNMSYTGTLVATNAGTYSVTFILKDKETTKWSDGTTSNKTVSWSISKASPSINFSTTGSTYSVYCSSSASATSTTDSVKTITVSDGASGPAGISFTYSLDGATGFSFNGKTVTVPKGAPAGSKKITLTAKWSETTNYTSGEKSLSITINVLAVSVSSYGTPSAPSITQKTDFPAGGVTLSTSNASTYFSYGSSSQTVTYNNGATRKGSVSYSWSGNSTSVSSLGTTVKSRTSISINTLTCTATGEGGKTSSKSVSSGYQAANSATYGALSSISFSQKSDFPASGVTLTSSNIGSYLTPSSSQTISFTSGSTRKGSVSYSWSGSYGVSNLGTTSKSRTSLTLSGLVCTASGEGSKSVTGTPSGYQAANSVTATNTEYGQYANSVTADKVSFDKSGGSSTAKGSPLAKSRSKYTWTSGSVSYSGWSDYITGGGGTWSSNASWIVLGTASGNNMPFTISANAGAARTGTITYTYAGIAKTVTISQAVATYTLDLNAYIMNTGGSYVLSGGLPTGAKANVYINGSLDSTVGDWCQMKSYGTTYAIKGFTNPTGFTFNATKSGYTAANGVSGTITSSTYVYPYYDRNKYTLSWSGHGGSLSGGTSAGSVYYGAGLTAPSASRTGYTFAGWSPSVPSTMPASNATYTATWTANTIKVNLNANGGSLPGTGEGKSYVNIKYDTTVGNYPSISLPSRTGYSFTGYFDASSGGTQYYNSAGNSVRTFNKTSETTLYAQWSLKYFTLSISSGSVTNYTISISKSSTYGGAVGSYTATSKSAQSISVPYGASYSISWASGTNTETTSGFTITWNGNGGSSPSATTSGNKTRTRSATNPTSSSSSITGNVSISANGWGSYGGYTYGTVGTLPSSSRARYTFAGWWTASSGGTQITTSTRPTGTVTYYAHWTANTVSVPTVIGNLIYNGAAQTGISGYNSSYMSYTGSLSATNAGSYSATFTIGSNYMWSDGTTSNKTISWSIGKASQSAPTAYGSSVTYNATATASASGGGKVGSIEWSNGSSRTAIGSQSTQARWSGNSNYNASAWSSAVTLAVSKYTTSITFYSTDRAYNGSALYASAYVNFPSGGKTPKGTIYYGTSSGSKTYSASYSGSSVALRSVNVVNYNASATVYAYFVPDTTCNDVYNQSGNASRTFKINAKAASALPTSWSGSSRTYHNTATVTATGYSGGTLYYRTSTDNSTWGSWSTTKPTRTAIGTTYVQCYVAGDSNHNNSSVSSSVSITVGKAADASMSVSLSSGLTYNGNAQVLAKVNSSHGVSTYYIGYNTSKTNASDSEVSWGSANGSVSATNGGTYYIYYKFSPDGNHSNSKSCTYVGSVTIGQKSGYGTVSISNWTYGQTASNPTASGSSSSITYTWYNSGKTQLSSRPGSTSAVGTYYIKATFAANSNYTSYTTDYVSFSILDTILSHNPSASIGSGITAAGGSASVTGSCTRTWASGKTDTSAISKVEITSNGNSRFSLSGTTISHSSMGTSVTTDTVVVKVTFADGSVKTGVSKSVANAITAHSATTSISNNFSAAGGYGDVTGSCTRTYTSGSKDSVGISKVEITSNGNSRFSLSGTRISHSSMGTTPATDKVSFKSTFTDGSTATNSSVDIVNKLESISLTLTPSTIKYGASSTPTTKATYTSGGTKDVSATYTSSKTDIAKVE